MEADFSGWATKSGIKCTDGRTIMPDAFKHQDQVTVPLVWQHQHNGPENILGHAILENRKEGVYTYGFFNDTEQGQNAKILVKHKDIDMLSIFARRLQEQGGFVRHGDITEVSLVLAGANYGARIDNVALAHSDGTIDFVDDEAVIYTGEELQHESPKGEEMGNQATKDDEELQHDAGEKTVQDVLDSLTPEQLDVFHLVLGEALAADDEEDKTEGDSAAHSINDEEFLAHIDTKIQEGFENMGRNVFEENGKSTSADDRPHLSHAQLQTILDDGQKFGSLKESFLAHAGEYGITDIDLLFPNPGLDGNGITFISRRMEWVAAVLDGVKKSPFSRIKSLSADITADEARAKGYVKGNLKKDEVIKMLRRITTPTTVYKKQKLDRDDIVDITEVDILTWIKGEMRIMLDEEVARAILVGDNRESDDDDKINEESIRPIAYDIDMYNTTVSVASTILPQDLIDQIVTGMVNFKGSGTPVFYTTRAVLTKMILSKDSLGRRFYATKAELAAALTVADVIPVEAMEENSDIVGVVVNLQDYTLGADKGGEINLFDFFDIDYNQQKYLLETRASGALTRPKSAVTFVQDAAHVVTPQAPTFVNTTGVVTIPVQTGVIYKNSDTGATLAGGAQAPISVGQTLNVEAVPAANYGFTHDAERDFPFTRV